MIHSLEFKEYKIYSNRVILTLVPLFCIVVFSMFLILDGNILANDFGLGAKGYLYVGLIISFADIPTIIYTIKCFNIFFKIHRKPLRIELKDQVPPFNIWKTYAIVYYVFMVDVFLVTFMPIKYCGIVGQMAFCIAFLLIGNATLLRNYIPANIVYAVVAFLGSWCANRFTPHTWLHWGNSLVYLPIQMTAPTVMLLMFAISVLNRINEMADLRNWKNIKKLEYMNSHDVLTGVYNRQMLDPEKFKNHYFLLFDIDFFKKVNDNFGHDMGDKVLKKVVQIVDENISKEDMIIRYGGEEFIVWIDKVLSKRAIHKFANDVRKKVKEQTLEIQDVNDPEYVPPITISIGVGYHDPKFTFEENIKVADQYLYEAKENGRNRVVSIINSKNPR